jgi:hypothetical protein
VTTRICHECGAQGESDGPTKLPDGWTKTRFVTIKAPSCLDVDAHDRIRRRREAERARDNTEASERMRQWREAQRIAAEEAERIAAEEADRIAADETGDQEETL